MPGAIALVLSRLPPMQIIILAVFVMSLVGLADWLTGVHVSLSMLYVAPVALATWYASKRAGILVAVFSIAVWLGADYSVGLSFVHPAIPIWNAAMRFGFLFITLSLLSNLRTHLENERRFAHRDSLTNLANRRTFIEWVEHSLALARRDGRPLTVAFVDLDDFKKINDSRGHGEGDRVLRVIARTLCEPVRKTGLIARVGGDEFAMLFPDTDISGAKRLLANIHRRLDTELERSAIPSCSIGAVTFLSAPGTAEEALKAADRVMYDVKRQGKAGVAHYVADPRSNGVGKAC